MLKSKKLTLNDIEQSLDDGIAGADVQRAEHLRNFQHTREAKANVYTREQARLTLKYGADHPRVSALSNKISVNRGIIGEVEQERVRASKPVPDADENSWIVHGFVRDENARGVMNMTVAFYDGNGRRLARLGHACTDGDGYFKITSSDLGETVFDKVYPGVSENKTRIFTDSSSLTPAPDTVVYREIRLGTGGSCPEPDDWNEPNTVLPPGGSGGGNGGGGEEENGDDEGAQSASTGWTVRGRVTDANGSGVSGLTISLYDEDLFFDDQLGATKTDEFGDYRFIYGPDDFRDLFEKRPDLYLKVIDRRGRTLYDSACDVEYDAGRVEVIDIELSE
jgi:protocatechuate 3,4-dioxygenase beta subunit